MQILHLLAKRSITPIIETNLPFADNLVDPLQKQYPLCYQYAVQTLVPYRGIILNTSH